MSSSQILTGVSVPNPVIGRTNVENMALGGMFLGWSPLRLTNYTIDAYGGDGTVQVLGSSSLVNSTIYMQGAGSNLLNEGLMTLQNSQLDINGSLSGNGMILATGGSTITVASSTPIKDTYQQPLTRQQSSDLASAQPQLVSLKSSTLNIEGNAANNYSGPVVMDGGSTINITGELNVGAKNLGIYATGPQLGTVNINTDQATHITGIMQVDANLNINSRGGVLEVDGGRLILGGFSTGDTIAITSGTLEFAQTPGFLQSPETASESFNSRLEFAGNSGSVQFDGASISSFILEHATPTSPTINQIAIFSQGHPIAALDLTPSATPYSASEFSVHGNTLLFHHS